VLGGTNFLGPAIVEQALSAGHEITLLNRRITRPHLFPDVEKLKGNRRKGSKGLEALGSSRSWDAVIDVWPAEEALVRDSASHLVDRAGYYFFVSSIAVYRSFARPWVTESAELRLQEDGYGGEKARAEKLIADLYPDRFGIARCPSILGPRDPGSTLHYWLRNLHQNTEVLAPGSGKDPIQFVDVRDVGRWVVESVQNKLTGVFNTTAPPLQFAEFLDACRAATQSQAKLTWLGKDYLYSQDVEAFTQLPLWVPVEEDPGFFQISSEKAYREGFRARSAGETLTAAWRWYQSSFFDGTTFPHNGWGLGYDQQEKLLSRWRASEES
jgi:2'-hydroxyisoflavone reductase